jgi:hypothetical protein
LDALAAHVGASKAFGYEGHRFRRFACLSLTELADHEAQLRGRPPDHYRSHLVEVGNGGAGPGYGLFPLRARGSTALSARRTDDLRGDPAASFPHDSAWNMPQHELVPPPGLGEAEYARWNREHDARYFAPEFLNGTVPIAHLGCAMWVLLVLNGRHAGEVWLDDRASDGGILPLEPTGFDGWYLDWLTDCERTVNTDHG